MALSCPLTPQIYFSAFKLGEVLALVNGTPMAARDSPPIPGRLFFSLFPQNQLF